MRYSDFSVNDIDLSVIGFPLWTLATRGWGKKDPSVAIYLLQQAFNQGINFFDTADSYGRGYGEELLREALAPIRKEIVISTKFGFDFYSPQLNIDGGDGKNFDPEYVSYACEQSLRRLGTDYIDMYLVHYPSYDEVENDDLYEVLEKLVEAGKILRFGLALDDRPEATEIARLLVSERELDLIHAPYSLLEQDLVSSLSETGDLSVIARRVHAFGLLDDSYDPKTFEGSDLGQQQDHPVFSNVLARRPYYDFLSDCFEESISDIALRFAITNRGIALTLPNINDIDNLSAYCLSADKPDLDNELMQIISDVFQEQKDSGGKEGNE
ncbi:MAG: aldo/keto reductase [Dehalococcoidia bacterium]|nr:aldo/keto reductase [Dehalococcoidia bacterium]